MTFKSALICFCTLLLIFKKSFSKTERPKLVIGIVVDQMRWDYLYRYEKLYGSDGFERLIRDGYNCQQTFINYLPSYTAAGHASIYTGSVPAFNGIVANDWFDRQSGRAMYCTEDTTVLAVGGSEKSGQMSPRNLLATTITDELRLATNFKSKVIGLSIKDRGAILPAGHSANAAYWYDAHTGHFMTSSFYRNSLPNWLLHFNQRQIGDSLMRQGWHLLLPMTQYSQSTHDDNEYEGHLKGETTSIFPHHTEWASVREDKGNIRYTPYANTLLSMLAEECISNENLGQDSNTDFLTLSFSATDYVGHMFGPNAIETEDTYLRLDQELADFLQFLDQKVGKGNYLLFLTADHGAAHNALFLNDHHIPAKSLSIRKVKEALNHYLFSVYQDSLLVHSLYNYQVFLNEKEIAQKKINRSELLDKIQNWLENQSRVTAVYRLDDDDIVRAPQPIQKMIKNGYYRNRCGSLQIILDPQWYSGYGQTGTTHGSWNPYDTHIPLLWYGWHITAGETYEKLYMTDIAATLAALLHIQMPNTCVGKVILPIMAQH